MFSSWWVSTRGHLTLALVDTGSNGKSFYTSGFPVTLWVSSGFSYCKWFWAFISGGKLGLCGMDRDGESWRRFSQGLAGTKFVLSREATFNVRLIVLSRTDRCSIGFTKQYCNTASVWHTKWITDRLVLLLRQPKVVVPWTLLGCDCSDLNKRKCTCCRVLYS